MSGDVGGRLRRCVDRLFSDSRDLPKYWTKREYLTEEGPVTAVIYLLYMVECWFSPHRHRLTDKSRVVDGQAAYDFVTSLRSALPVVRWSAVSYHYIRSAVASTAMTSSLRHHRQRVVTHRDATAYRYAPDALLDCSAALADLEAFPVTWLRISCQFSFSSASARRDFARQRDEFYGDHRMRDQHVDFRQTLSLLSTFGSGGGGHIGWSRDVVVYGRSARPWYTSVAVYWLASVLVLSWPLRIVVQWRTARLDYTVHKVFNCRDAASRDGYDVTEEMEDLCSTSSSASSIHSDSITSDTASMLTDSDRVLVPSYSQALLMDTRTLSDHKADHHHQLRQQWRHGSYGSRLRRVQSCLAVHRRASSDVKQSTSVTSQLCRDEAGTWRQHVRTAVLMTSRPPSYNTAMCTAAADVAARASTLDAVKDHL